jgi:aminopeptidase N
MTLKITAFACVFIIFSQKINAQQRTPQFTHDDTLRGSITKERAWWDVTYYALKLSVKPSEKALSGSTTIQYRVLAAYQTLQVDLQPPLVVERITQDGKPLTFRKEGTNAYMVALEKPQQRGAIEAVVVEYSGKPQVAKNAPWDGGFSWAKDADGQPFVATSCEGLGASVWWPCKDHMSDEPDSMLMSVTVPNGLTDVSNGRLRQKTDNADGSHTFDWFVKNPINNYGVNVNIGQYVHFSDTFRGEKGILDLDFYVLPKNLEKAKIQFPQAKLMLTAFEHWFGPYPFYEDGYKLVEVPYLGMEHQSSVTYGNGYKNGYRGTDLSGTGWGLKWDFIIIHESGHEWFANNITCKDIADMWIHESFTHYSESLYTEFYFGKKAGAEYARGVRKRIANDRPIIGNYNVNKEGSGDMYYKGGNMLHTIRQIVNDDEKWRQILRGLSETFYHQTVTTQQIEDFMSQRAGIKLNRVFDQYLRNVEIPILEYQIKKGKLHFRWTNCVEGFDMPVLIGFDDQPLQRILPTTTWQKIKAKGVKTVQIDENFYVNATKVE